MRRKSEKFRIKPTKRHHSKKQPTGGSGQGMYWGGSGKRMRHMSRSQFKSMLRSDPQIRSLAKQHGWDGNNNAPTGWLYCLLCCVIASCCDGCGCGLDCMDPPESTY